MAWRTTEDIETYLAAAGAFLRSRPAAHTVPLTVVETLRTAPRVYDGPDTPLYGWWQPADGPVAGALLQTPPHPVVLATMPAPAAAALPAALIATGRSFPGVTGGRAVVEGFAEAWRRHTGAAPRVQMRQRLYRLGTLRPPHSPPPGGPRVATPPDRDLLIEWYEMFSAEAGTVSGARRSAVDDRIGYGGFVLWEADGTPVAFAGRSRVVAGMGRVGPVFTPPAHRRRGFGAAVTAAVTQAALAGGAREVVLFTDLTNPTSNSIYQQIGYQPVDDHLMVSFYGRPGTGRSMP
jgi:predicted GNAT family acetyltransferase